METPDPAVFDPVAWLARDCRLFIPAVATAILCIKRRLFIDISLGNLEWGDCAKFMLELFFFA